MRHCELLPVLLVSMAPLRSAPQMLVTADWLSQHVKDANLVVLHVGAEKDYSAGHIPGARLVTLSDVSVTGERGLRLELPPISALQETFGKLAIGEDSRVVIYSGNGVVQSATRVWFTFDAAGLGARASLLDGGIGAWKAANLPVSTEVPGGRPARANVSLDAKRVVDAAWVRGHLKDVNVRVLDARLPEFYSGANAGGMPRSGHIPGATSVPFSTLLDEQQRFRPEAELRKLLGADPGQTVVSYCHIGQQATVVYFAARLLGLDARLYDGSFQDWSARTDLPVEP